MKFLMSGDDLLFFRDPGSELSLLSVNGEPQRREGRRFSRRKSCNACVSHVHTRTVGDGMSEHTAEYMSTCPSSALRLNRIDNFMISFISISLLFFLHRSLDPLLKARLRSRKVPSPLFSGIHPQSLLLSLFRGLSFLDCSL